MRRLAALAILLASCDAQVDADYGGEPLAVLSGVIDTPSRASVDALVVRWSTADPRGPGEHASRTRLSTSFPNAFAAALLATPPDAALLRCAPGEPRLAEGYLFALDEAGATVGADFAHVLVWLDSDAAPGSPTAAYLGAPLAAGFHVMLRTEEEAPPPSQAPMIAACIAAGLAAGWDEARARAVCPQVRAYQLAPAPFGFEERWVVNTVVSR